MAFGYISHIIFTRKMSVNTKIVNLMPIKHPGEGETSLGWAGRAGVFQCMADLLAGIWFEPNGTVSDLRLQPVTAIRYN